MGNEDIINKYVIGVDECGMGSVAGKVVVCAVRAPVDWSMDGLCDSKKTNINQRGILKNQLMDLVSDNKIQFFISTRTNEDIDKHTLGVCHKICVAEAINNLYIENDEVIMDGNLNPSCFFKHGLRENCNIRTEIKADDKYATVMAASIIAKQYKDVEMIELDKEYPEYEWKENMGYASKQHKQVIKDLGYTKYHRKSYKIKL